VFWALEALTAKRLMTLRRCFLSTFFQRLGNGKERERDVWSISLTFYEQLLRTKIKKKAQERLTTWLYFLHFWDLHLLGVKCWWNRPQIVLYKKSVRVDETEDRGAT